MRYIKTKNPTLNTGWDFFVNTRDGTGTVPYNTSTL